MAKLEKLTQEERVAIVDTFAPAWKPFTGGNPALTMSLRNKGVVGAGGGLTDLGKLLRQKIMDQMMEELL